MEEEVWGRIKRGRGREEGVGDEEKRTVRREGREVGWGGVSRERKEGRKKKKRKNILLARIQTVAHEAISVSILNAITPLQSRRLRRKVYIEPLELAQAKNKTKKRLRKPLSFWGTADLCGMWQVQYASELSSRKIHRQ